MRALKYNNTATQCTAVVVSCHPQCHFRPDPEDYSMPRTRYFRNAVRTKPNFEWTSDPLSPPARPSDYLHYSSFTLNSLTVEVGDYVLIRNNDRADYDILGDTDVARLDRLYQNYENKKDPYRAVVTWLCRPAFLPRALDGSHGQEEEGVPSLDSQHEVVQEVRQFERDISAETVVRVCRVLEGDVFEEPKKFAAQHQTDPAQPCYLMRFKLKKEQSKKGRQSFSINPVKPLSSKLKSPAQKLVAKPQSPKVTPLRVNLANFKANVKNKSSAVKADEASLGSSPSPPPELSSFVTGTVGSPQTRAGLRGKVITGESFTEVKTSTGSGRKLTIKCGTARGASQTTTTDSPKLRNKTDNAESVVKTPRATGEPAPSSEEPRKPAVLRRSRRVSVSCTTPHKTDLPLARPRPASERKKRMAESSDSDEDFVPTKPKLRRGAVRPEASSESDGSDFEMERRPVARTRPASQPVRKKVFTPRVAGREVPLPTNADPMAEAQQRLHVSAVPASLPCREEEFAEILGYIESKLQEGAGGCCYISGVPGTGKTATVMEVVRYLQDNSQDYQEFDFFSMNGMRLTSPEQAYVEMWRQLTGAKATPEHAMKLLDTRFSSPQPRRRSAVFLVDELDMLCNKKQSVLYNIFDWPSRPGSKLIVVAIANTMDLPERVMINRVSSRLGLTRQTFQPYSHTQLQTIVASRLAGLEVFHQDAVQLVARKVASLSGDARRALDICRRAAELGERAGAGRVGVAEVARAHQEMFSSPKILAVRSCCRYGQLVLQVLVAEVHRTGVEESTVGAVQRELRAALRSEGLALLSLPGTTAILSRLAAVRLILAEHFRLGLETKIRLNVSTEEVNFALKKSED